MSLKLKQPSPDLESVAEEWKVANIYYSRDKKYKRFFRPRCIPVLVLIVLIVQVNLFPFCGPETRKFSFRKKSKNSLHICPDACKLQIVESIPEGMEYRTGPKFQSTFHTFENLISQAEHTINIASFYWAMRSSQADNHSSSWQGDKIFKDLLFAGRDRKINITIVQNFPSNWSSDIDTMNFMEQGAATVRLLNVSRLLGGGILHSKLWIIDDKHFYLGSANMGWRSLTQVKELGLFAQNCSCLTTDLKKIFDIYWELGDDNSKIPDKWPDSYSTSINSNSPMLIKDGNNSMLSFFSSSPQPFSANGRADDLQTILSIIASAKKFIHISMMDYIPLVVYTPKIQYWDHIDKALRIAAIDNKIPVKLLTSHWERTKPIQTFFLKSLAAIKQSLKGMEIDIQVKCFIVPTSGEFKKIPFVRFSHNKYMVTEQVGFIETSNWVGDYFKNNVDISFVSNGSNSPIRNDLEKIFERDWNSQFAVDIDSINLTKKN